MRTDDVRSKLSFLPRTKRNNLLQYLRSCNILPKGTSSELSWPHTEIMEFRQAYLDVYSVYEDMRDSLEKPLTPAAFLNADLLSIFVNDFNNPNIDANKPSWKYKIDKLKLKKQMSRYEELSYVSYSADGNSCLITERGLYYVEMLKSVKRFEGKYGLSIVKIIEENETY